MSASTHPFVFALGAPSEESTQRTHARAQSEPLADVDREVFARLYTRLAPRIHRFLSDLLFDSVLARDATQETFARALLHIGILHDEARATPWIFGIARNVSLEVRKARARASRVTSLDDTVDLPAAEASSCPEATLEGRQAARKLRAALAALPEERRAILLLRLDHGLSYDDIAASMGISLAKVKVDIFRARETLREHLERHDR